MMGRMKAPFSRGSSGNMMTMDYLLKTEPSEYSFADLERDQSTVWDGVSNPVALKNLRAMKPGDRLVLNISSQIGSGQPVTANEAAPAAPGKPLAAQR